MVGGVPLYVEQHDRALTLEENIAENILRVDSFLFGEPESYLQQELRDPAMYNAVVQAIALGIGKPVEIADAAGIALAALANYLKTLWNWESCAKSSRLLARIGRKFATALPITCSVSGTDSCRAISRHCRPAAPMRLRI